MKHSAILRLFACLALVLGGLPLAAQAQATLIPAGSDWKFLDNGSDQGTAWRAVAFTDGGWAEGPAPLGYGDMDEATLVGFGPDPNAKFITTYFRRSFQVANPATITNLLLRLVRDDGAIVYLNGVEIFRDNMPEGSITYTNLALAAIGGADETTFILTNPSPALLVAGTNVIAVEIHQNAGNSSDLSFDLELVGNFTPAVPTVVITSPADGANLAADAVTLLATATDSDGVILKVEFFQAGSKVGEDTVAPYSFTVTNLAPGGYVFYARATDSTGLTAESEDIFVRLNPPAPTLVRLGATWKYLVTPTAADPGWTNLNFNDATWPQGPGRLGYGDGGEGTLIGFGGDAANKYVTTYFRHQFVVENPAAYAGLTLTLVYDDGAVIYLNGVEVKRINMPAAPTTYATLASSAQDYAPDVSPLSPLTLVAGTNILAVEMHQGNVTSSDLAMDLQIQGVLPPTVTITSPANGASLAVPVNFTFSADATDPDGSVARVDFFAGNILLGSDSTAPFSITVTNLLEGSHQLTAVATDNGGASGTSTPITVTVADPNPPTIAGVTALSNKVSVFFSKAVVQPSATALTNYSLNQGASILSAAYGPNSNTVELTTSVLNGTATYTLTINHVRDRAGNTIAPNSQVSFQLSSFLSGDVGNPITAGLSLPASGGYNVSGAGSDIGGNSDQFQFSYESSQKVGDFDVQVRVNAFQATDAWAKAALMARENLTGGARYAASIATPGISGCFFQNRSTAGGATTRSGYAPVTYPNTYLRLKRQGSTFTGYSSVDGNHWVQLGTTTLALPANLYVGFAVSSRNPSQTATAQFRNYGDVSGGTIGSLVLDREPPGPSSRNTGIAITEIHYNPRNIPGATNRSLEFIEIYNSQSHFENIGGFRLTGAINYTLPPNTVLQPNAYVVVARDPSFVQSHYGITGVLGPWDDAANNGLPNNGGQIRLRGLGNNVILQVDYQTSAPWPDSADGAGHSLVLARASYGEGDVRAWAASDLIDGSPGAADPFGADPLRTVRINEFLANSTLPAVDFIELYNRSNQEVDLSGAWLTDSATTNKYRIPNGTRLGARSYLALTETTLGFALAADGEGIYLVNSNLTRVIDAVRFDGQQAGVSSGRSPDGADAIYRLASLTLGTNNAGLRPDPIVINEIMYSPIFGDSRDEYIELHNRGSTEVNLGGWRVKGGVTYTIPGNTLIPSNGFVVIAKDAARLRGNYPALNTANTVGNFEGTLANGGERLILTFPEPTVVTNNGVVTTNYHDVNVNEVTFADRGRWGYWAKGGGSSLELKDPWGDNRQAANWTDSDETSKGIWTTIEVTGGIGETLGSPVNDNLQLFLLGIGECLVDEVEVRVNNGPNLLTTNPGFESGALTADSVGVNLNSWVAQGSHDHSVFENSGFVGSRSMRLRASSRGDNGANRVRSQAFGGIAGTNITLRARAKWLRGWPELLLRLHGGGLEVGGRMNIRPDLGTPGAVNSRRIANAGPAIYDVVHSPILPGASEAVVVTARANDAHAPLSVRLKYRVEPTATFTTVTMVDNGTGGDRIAGDGLYSATIPGQAANASVAFYVEASDGLGAVNTFPQDVFPPAGETRIFPLDAVSRECLIRWGQVLMTGSFGNYHLWLNTGNSNRWRNRLPRLNNTPLDGTFVYNNYRVIYNMRPQYAGSPWHRGQMTSGPSAEQRVDYDIEFPEDDRFLGSVDAVWNNPGNPGGTSTSDTSGQSEQTTYQIFKEIGVHYNHRRYVHVFCNGNLRSTTANLAGAFIFEDSQQPNGDIIESWFPEDETGSLFKIEDWFEFPDNGDDFYANNDADLIRRTTTTNGVTTLHTAAYRFMWRARSRGAGESGASYDDFYTLLNLTSPTMDQGAPINLKAFESIADYEQWMRIFACQHTVGNWDTYGYNRGKNAYTYKSGSGRFHQWTWDIDFTMGIGGDGATTDIFGVSDPRITQMWNNPAIRRAYWRAFQDIVNGPLNNAFMDPILDAKAASLAANGVTYDPGAVTTIKSYITARRNYLLTTRGGENVSLLQGLPLTAGPPSVTSANNLVTINGTAPITAKHIYINGAAYDVTWVNLSNWTARIALQPGVNTLRVIGVDLRGNTVGSTQTVTATYTGVAELPQNHVVISEIQFNPAVPDAEFVELFNTSSNTTFDLSGFDFDGLDYTFPAGSIIAPRTYLVLAKNRPAFASAYGVTIPVHDQFEGNLQSGGETLSLIKPALTNAFLTNATAVVIDRVRYEEDLPWPRGSNNVPTAASLQLIDSLQDNSRPLNWSTLYQPPIYSPATNFPGATNAGWRYVQYTGTISSAGSNFWIWMSSITGGELYLDDLHLNVGSVAEAGPNLLVNGDFEQSLATGWQALGNHSNSVVSTAFSRSGSGSLRVLASGQGTTLSGVRQFITAPPSNVVHTLSYWFYSTVNATNLTIRTVAGSAFINITNVQPQVIPPFSNPATLVSPAVVSVSPGTNSTSATNLATIPTLWLNELQASNTVGLLDNAGDRDPWIELYNPGPATVSLTGLYLANNYDTNLLQWAFPAGSSVAPGEFKVIWADGEPGESTASQMHTSFRLGGTAGTVALVRVSNNSTQVLDYLTYRNTTAGLSYGDYPNGQPFYRQVLYSPTPGASNVAQAFPLYINEWMAGNTGAILDPADGNFDDWFEIFNAGTADIDLGGFYLTDNLGNPTQYRIPATGNHVVPAGGHLVVWADNSTNQNSSATNSIHARFQLSLTGEQIGLFAPDGSSLVSGVTFGPQANNVGEGRFPDGSASIYFLTNHTPGYANALSVSANTAPVLAAIASRTNRTGQLISFTASASDAEAPPQVLSFSLTGVVPTGASISSGGIFSWTPGPEYAFTTNLVTVRVSDSGSPSLQASRSFTITVLPPPTAAIAAIGGNVQIAFDAIPGRNYRVDYKNSLDAAWLALSAPFTATSPAVILTDSLAGQPNRFYRIVQLD
ncbi:MAG: hypothetical protein RJA22_1062 [Verrucomicrobiota bacterium]